MRHRWCCCGNAESTYQSGLRQRCKIYYCSNARLLLVIQNSNLPPLLNNEKKMDREKLKLIVRNLKLLVDSLEAEVFSDVDAYKYENYNNEMITDYDEVFEDDDG